MLTASGRFGSLAFDGRNVIITHKRGGGSRNSEVVIPKDRINTVTTGRFMLRERWVRFSVAGEPLVAGRGRSAIIRDTFALLYWAKNDRAVKAIVDAVRNG